MLTLLLYKSTMENRGKGTSGGNVESGKKVDEILSSQKKKKITGNRIKQRRRRRGTTCVTPPKQCNGSKQNNGRNEGLWSRIEGRPIGERGRDRKKPEGVVPGSPEYLLRQAFWWSRRRPSTFAKRQGGERTCVGVCYGREGGKKCGRGSG